MVTNTGTTDRFLAGIPGTNTIMACDTESPDLCATALTTAFGLEMFIGPGDVHYTEVGSWSLAQQVTACIKTELKRQ
jgi:hypothetical protein